MKWTNEREIKQENDNRFKHIARIKSHPENLLKNEAHIFFNLDPTLCFEGLGGRKVNEVVLGDNPMQLWILISVRPLPFLWPRCLSSSFGRSVGRNLNADADWTPSKFWLRSASAILTTHRTAWHSTKTSTWKQCRYSCSKMNLLGFGNLRRLSTFSSKTGPKRTWWLPQGPAQSSRDCLGSDILIKFIIIIIKTRIESR